MALSACSGSRGAGGGAGCAGRSGSAGGEASGFSANSNINIEKDASTTVANGWEELTYDFSGIVNSNNYQRVVVFFDFGNAGTGATYYFDDIKLN